MRVKNISNIVLAALLACAACGRDEQSTGGMPAAADRTPGAAPAQELPAPDTGAAAAATPPNAAPGTPSGRPPATPPGGRAAGSAGAPAGGAQPRPTALAAPPPSAPPPAAEPQQPQVQNDGAAVLQRASAAYANLRSLRADFVMHYSNPLLRQQTTSRGTLYQRRPDRVALRFTDPAGDVILSDGQFYWIYYPSIDAQQVIRCPTSAGSGEQGADLQAQFVGDPVRRFRYTLHGQESVGGRSAHVLTLEPREQAGYKRLKVWLDTRDSLARRFEITELNNTVRRFELSDFDVNAGIPDATFRFTPPANARIVDCP
jgi:outer membrane lipoprotein-sorting protein